MDFFNFLKGPLTSEDSIYIEYQFLIVPRYLVENVFNSGFENQQGFTWFQRLSGHQTSSVNVFVTGLITS